jgi:hypothetical protein
MRPRLYRQNLLDTHCFFERSDKSISINAARDTIDAKQDNLDDGSRWLVFTLTRATCKTSRRMLGGDAIGRSDRFFLQTGCGVVFVTHATTKYTPNYD